MPKIIQDVANMLEMSYIYTKMAEKNNKRKDRCMGKLRTVIRKVDSNHAEIVEAFRRLGYSVKSTATLGKGFPDAVCAKMGHTFHIEIKDGKLPASKRRLSEDEEIFWREWLGPIYLIQSIDDVIALDRKRHQRIKAGTL